MASFLGVFYCVFYQIGKYGIQFFAIGFDDCFLLRQCVIKRELYPFGFHLGFEESINKLGLLVYFRSLISGSIKPASIFEISIISLMILSIRFHFSLSYRYISAVQHQLDRVRSTIQQNQECHSSAFGFRGHIGKES
jgi:hypothetical protein